MSDLPTNSVDKLSIRSIAIPAVSYQKAMLGPNVVSTLKSLKDSKMSSFPSRVGGLFGFSMSRISVVAADLGSFVLEWAWAQRPRAVIGFAINTSLP